jgi:uncharacterized membrane protein
MSNENESGANNLGAELQNLKDRLHVIELKLGIVAGQNAFAKDAKDATTPNKKDLVPPTRSSNPPIVFVRTETSKQTGEEPSSGRLLGFIGVFFFILAASYFIKLALDSGWLTPVRQLGAVIFFGVSLIAAGFRLQKRDAPYASLLPATGIVVLDMAAYGGHLYYGLFGSDTAIIAISGLALFTLILYRSFLHESYLVLAVVGSYSVPLLLRGYTFELLNIYLYLVAWSVAYVICGLYFGRRILLTLAGYFAIALGAATIIHPFELYHPAQLSQAIFLQALLFSIFCIGQLLFSIRRNSPLTSVEAWLLCPALLIFYWSEYPLVETMWGDPLAGWIAIAFATGLVIITIAARTVLRRESIASAPMVAFSVAMILFHALYGELLPSAFAPWFGLLMAGTIALISTSIFPYHRFWQAHLVGYAVFGLEYVGLLVEGQATLTVITLSALYAAALIIAHCRSGAEHSIFLLLGTLQMLAAGWYWAALYLPPSALLYGTSAVWAIFALGFLIWGLQRKDMSMRQVALGLFGVVSLKVLLFDSAADGPLARIVALIVIGTVLYTGGLILRRVSR